MTGEHKQEPSPRQKSLPFFAGSLLIAAFSGSLLNMARQSLQVGDVLQFAGGMGLAAYCFCIWRHYWNAPSMDFIRTRPKSPVEQWASILGWSFLCASYFFPSTAFTNTPHKGHFLGSFIFIFMFGLQAVVGLFSFVQERMRLRRTSRLF